MFVVILDMTVCGTLTGSAGQQFKYRKAARKETKYPRYEQKQLAATYEGFCFLTGWSTRKPPCKQQMKIACVTHLSLSHQQLGSKLTDET